MAEEVEVELEEEPAAVAEKTESEPTEKTEQDTQPEKEAEKSYTKAEVEEIMAKRAARIERKLQREYEAKHKVEPPKPEPVKGEPKLEDFETTEEYLDARTDWRVEQKEKERAAKTAEEREKAEVERINAKYRANAEKVADKYPDYDDVVESLLDPQIPFYVKQAVKDSDLGGELAYFLGSNPDELDKLMDLSPYAAVKAIGKLEVKLEQPKAKEISKAPAPFKGVKGDSPTDSTEIKDGEPYESFVRKRNIQLGRV